MRRNDVTRRAMRSEAYYRDYLGYSRRALCDRVVYLEDELAKAERRRTARPVVTSDEDTDGATGACACGECGRPIDPWDAWCRHCGARMEVEG